VRLRLDSQRSAHILQHIISISGSIIAQQEANSAALLGLELHKPICTSFPLGEKVVRENEYLSAMAGQEDEVDILKVEG
jgi:hypothetical protein